MTDARHRLMANITKDLQQPSAHPYSEQCAKEILRAVKAKDPPAAKRLWKKVRDEPQGLTLSLLCRLCSNLPVWLAADVKTTPTVKELFRRTKTAEILKRYQDVRKQFRSDRDLDGKGVALFMRTKDAGNIVMHQITDLPDRFVQDSLRVLVPHKQKIVVIEPRKTFIKLLTGYNLWPYHLST